MSDDLFADPHKLADQLLAEVTSIIDESLALLEKGEHVHLEGLDEKVNEMCQAVLHLSKDDARKYTDMLQSLTDELTRLGNALAENRDLVGRQIKNLGLQKRAMQAYKTSEIMGDGDGPKPPKKESD